MRTDFAIAAGILVFNLLLAWPVFLPGESPYRGSIEMGYIGMARWIAGHPNPWRWYPLQYGGLPVQHVYVPAVLYSTAALHWITGLPVERAYRLFTALFPCLAPVSIYVLVRYFGRSRWWAVAAALAYTIWSPAYGLFRIVELDRGFTHLPWRWHVYVKYGEGPHSMGLALLPLVPVALHRHWLAGAALLALITLTNWVAGLALAIVCVILVLSGMPASRVMLAGAVAYGLACFWMTPTFIRTVAFNWPEDAYNYQLQLTQWWLLAALAVALGALALGLRRMELFARFVTLCAVAFGWIAVMYHSYRIDIIPESRRYVLEFEMFLLLALAVWFRLIWIKREPLRRYCAVVAAIAMMSAGFGQARRFVAEGWDQWAPVSRDSSAEYHVARWIAEQHPAGRVLASGGLRFRLNAWFDVPQVGGSFESGLSDRRFPKWAEEIRDAKPGWEDLVRAAQVEYIVVHGPRSREYYRDVKQPERFAAAYEPVYQDADSTVYRVPFNGVIAPREWHVTVEQKAAAAVSVATWLGCFVWTFRKRRA